MQRAFRLTFWAGMTLGLGWFWYIAFMPSTPVVEACGLSALVMIVGGALGQALYRYQHQFDEAAIKEKLARAKEQASERVAATQEQSSQIAKGVGMPAAKYLFGFDGVASRLEYFLAQLFSGTAILVLLAIIMISESESTVLISFLLLLAASLVQLAFGFRRTRDIGVNQWWFLLVLVPPVNLAVLVALFVIPTGEFKGKGF